MELAAYTGLIKELPYKTHAFETKKATWEPFAKSDPFSRFYEDVFTEDEEVTISRGDLFSMATTDPYKAVFSTILWGYPRGYTRGNNMARSFPLFLKQVEYLSHQLSTQPSISIDELKRMLNTCKGVGLSTLSKLLYFFNIKIEGSRGLILDTRIIGVLIKGKFTELSSLSGIREHNKESYYAPYLRICAALSNENGYMPDQLELFLFMFGSNLKAS